MQTVHGGIASSLICLSEVVKKNHQNMFRLKQVSEDNRQRKPAHIARQSGKEEAAE